MDGRSTTLIFDEATELGAALTRWARTALDLTLPCQIGPSEGVISVSKRREKHRDFVDLCDSVGFHLEPFQKRISYALLGPEREKLVTLPRKNGKSRLTGAFAAFHLLTTPQAQVIVVANSKEQAEIIDRSARDVAMHPAVEQEFEPRFRDLCGEEGIKIMHGKDLHGHYARQRPPHSQGATSRALVRIPKIETRCDYYVALHEIGHIVLDGGDRAPTAEQLDRERAAWDWAIEQARVPQTQAVRAMIRRALQTYGAQSGREFG